MSEKKEPKQLSEAEILLLHRKSNPADDLYEGEPVDNEAENPQTTQFGGYDLTDANIEGAQVIATDADPGDTAHSTEDVTKANTEDHKEDVKAKAATEVKKK